jgi:ATP-dependent helicase/nuclease subunit A
MLDFDDLLFYAHRLLTDANHAALREQLSDDLQLLLVDEFQDTDQLQVNLVLALCGVGFKVGRLFFVGDFKQSIYRFRGAKPQVFRDLREQVEEAGRLPLTLNFRSQPAVLEFVNALFCDMFQAAGQKYDALMASRPQTTARPSAEFLWTIDANKNKGLMAGAAIAARRKEAQRIARRLRSLLDETSDERPIVDKDSKQPRELQPGDVAILFRTLSDVQVYEEALRDYELDYYLVGGHAFYAQQEIFDVLNLLRAVASTADEVSLAGVLRSPFFALADETLFWLVESGGTLNGGLFAEHPPRDLSADEQQKVIAAADTIRHLRTVKDRVSIAALLSQALERTGYDAVLLAEFLGERKLANLHKLMERARAADQGGVIDLDGFITQLAQLISQQPKESLAATLPEAANVIRLMTIHHAKGLEFPLVVVPDLDRPPRFGSPPAAFHPEFGPLVSPPDVEGEQNDSASGMSLFNAIEKAEELEERKRLLYVACTRAADYLILSSSLEAYDVLKGDWTQQLAERFELDTGKLCATLPSDYVTPTVRITPDSDLNRKPTSRARRPDLLKVLDEAHRLAGEGQGIVPGEVAPIPVNGAARRQFSFSRLTGQIIRGSAPTAVSPWTTDEQHGTSPVVDPRGLGTLVHDLLARVDLSDAAAISDWAEHLAPEHVLRNADEASRTAAEMVRRFFEAKRGRDIAAAKAAQREVEFLLAWPPDQANGDGTYLRGFIDCLYMDADNRWILVDYKTDNIPAAAVPRAAERYAMQLYVYAIAAERVLGQPPAALVLHFLKPGVEHVFAWDADARDTAINMVNNAIDDARQSAFRVQRSDAYRAPYSEP